MRCYLIVEMMSGSCQWFAVVSCSRVDGDDWLKSCVLAHPILNPMARRSVLPSMDTLTISTVSLLAQNREQNPCPPKKVVSFSRESSSGLSVQGTGYHITGTLYTDGVQRTPRFEKLWLTKLFQEPVGEIHDQNGRMIHKMSFFELLWALQYTRARRGNEKSCEDKSHYGYRLYWASQIYDTVFGLRWNVPKFGLQFPIFTQ